MKWWYNIKQGMMWSTKCKPYNYYMRAKVLMIRNYTRLYFDNETHWRKLADAALREAMRWWPITTCLAAPPGCRGCRARIYSQAKTPDQNNTIYVSTNKWKNGCMLTISEPNNANNKSKGATRFVNLKVEFKITSNYRIKSKASTLSKTFRLSTKIRRPKIQ